MFDFVVALLLASARVVCYPAGDCGRIPCFCGRRRTVHTINLLMDIAVIIIAIQLFVFLVIPIGLLFLVNKGVAALPKLMRRYAPRVQFRFRQAAEIAEQASQKVCLLYTSPSPRD